MSTKSPPIPVENFVRMLAWSMRDIQSEDFALFGRESFEFDHTADLLGLLLAHHLDRAVRQGLYRQYQPVEDMILGIRGTLDPWQTTSRFGQLSGKTVCRWDELNTNHAVHRGITYYANLLLSTNHLQSHTRMKLEELVDALQCAKSTPNDGEHLFRQRLPHHLPEYQKIVWICRLVQHSSIPDDSGAELEILDLREQQKFMSSIFEKFLRKWFQNQLQPNGWSVGSRNYNWSDVNSKKPRLPLLKTDIVIEHKPLRRACVIDAKYLIKPLSTPEYGEPTLLSEHIQQMFSYLHSVQRKHPSWEISGMLLYAQPSGIAFQVNHMVHDFPLHGVTLNLNQPWNGVLRDLQELSERLIKAPL